MPFAKEQLLEIARHYEAEAKHPHFGLLYAACAAGLRAWEARRGFYRKTLDAARPFLAELENHIIRIFAGSGGLTPENEQEAAFVMVECLACMIREVALTSGAETPDEEAVLSYFETCGEWRSNDGHLASEYFFKRIPAAVLCRTATVLDAGLRPVVRPEDGLPSQ